MPDRSPPRTQNARAYLLLILDTREVPIGVPGTSHCRRVSINIFTERHPTLAGYAQAFQITMASGPSFAWCQNELLKLVDGDPNGQCADPECVGQGLCPSPPAPYAWVKPLLHPQARFGHPTQTPTEAANVPPGSNG